MRVVKYYPYLLWTGSLLWMAGFFLAAALVYPYCWFGIYLSPPILVIGIIGWIIDYTQSRKTLPDPVRTINKTLSKHKGAFKYHHTMFDLLLSYVPHFWTFCIVFWMALTFLFTTIFKQSDAFAKVKCYVANDPELKERIGTIRYYGFLIGGSISSNGNDDLSFSLIGEKETVSARAVLEGGEIIHVEYHDF